MQEAAIVFSAHARQAMAERSLDEEWVIETIRHPRLREPDPRHLERWRVFRRIVERDGRVLKVVCTWQDGAVLVITAHLDRSKRHEDLV